MAEIEVVRYAAHAFDVFAGRDVRGKIEVFVRITRGGFRAIG